MIRAELYKIRHHRTPWVLTGLLAAALSAGPAVMVFREPSNPAMYLEVLTAIFALAALVVAAVFGGWMFGHEYRQGTVQRLFSLDAGRLRLFAVKGGVAAGVLSAALAVAAGFGVLTTWIAAELNGATLDFGGLGRELLGVGFVALVVAALAYAASVAFRNDTYAMLVPIGLMLVFDPLLRLIPTVGDYMPGAVAAELSDRIAGAGELATMSASTAGLALAAWIGASLLAGGAALSRRDV